MELVSLCPFPAELLLWEADAGQASLTVVVKVTLRLVQDGDAVVADEQIAIGGDEAWDETPGASLFQPGDRAPLKPRTDLMLVGHAYAPGGRPVERLVAQLKIGDFTKSVAVTGTRLWTRTAAGFVPGPPLPFEQMPLRYERGALSQDNPVGVDPASPPLEGAAVGPVLSAVAPATSPCFGPVTSTWRPRRRLLGDAGRFWALAFETAGAAPAEPAPRALDFRFFNAAPPDQQTNLLRQRAEIELTNLSPVHATLRSRLPALRPQVFLVSGPDGRAQPVSTGAQATTGPGARRAQEVALRCDTLWIDSDRGIVCLLWRGLTDVPSMSPDAVGTVIVVADPQGRRVRYDQVERAWREGIPIEATEAGAQDALSMRHDAIRSRAEAASPGSEAGGEPREKDETRAINPVSSASGRAVLPFAGGNAVPALDRQVGLGHARASQSATPFGGREVEPPTFGLPEMEPAAFTARDVQVEARAPEPGPGPLELRAGVEEQTHDKPADEAVAPVLPFAQRPAMIAIPAAPTLPRERARESESGRERESAHESVSQVVSAATALGVALPGEPLRPVLLAAPPKPELLLPAAPPAAAVAPTARVSEPPRAAPKSLPPPEPPGFEPKDVAIGTYGAVSAELMIKRGERAKVLEHNHLSEPAWARIHAYWTAEMGRETARGESKLLAQFDAAYVETMGRLRKPIGIPEYAAILVAIERGAVDKQLASLSLSLSDLMRVQRVWTRRIVEEPETGKVLGKAVEEARAAVTKPSA